MKKLLKILKWLFIGLLTLILLVATYFFITGIPKADTITFQNVPKIKITNLLTLKRKYAQTTNRTQLLGFDANNNLIIRKNYREQFSVDGKTDSVVSSSLQLPYGAHRSYMARVKDSNDYLFLRIANAAEDKNLLKFNIETRVTDTVSIGTSSITDFSLSPDGSSVLVYNEDHNTGKNTLYLQSLNSNDAPKYLCNFKGLVKIQGFDAEMKNAYILQSFTEQDSKLYRVDLETGKAELEFPYEAEKKYFNGNQFTWYVRHQRFLATKNDSIAYYVRTGDTGLSKEFAVIWEYNLNSKVLIQVSPDFRGDVGHIALSADQRYLVYLVMEKGFGKLYAYDRVKRENIVLYDDKNFPVYCQYDNRPFMVHPIENKVYFNKFSLNTFEAFVIDIETKSVLSIDPYQPKSMDSDVAFSEFIYSTTADTIGAMNGIHSYIYKPIRQSNEKLPVIIKFHGGPDSYDPPFSSIAAQWVDDRFAVITPNYRGSSSYGVTFEKADDQINRPRQIEDVGALVDWIKTQDDLDHKKIVLVGESWGGFMVTASLAKYPDLFLGGITINGAGLGVVDEDATGLLAGWGAQEMGLKGDPELNKMIQTLSPYENADKIKKPLLIIQAAEDARVSVESARTMVNAIEKNQGKVWYMEIANVGHVSNLGGLENTNKLAAMEQFIDELIKW